jgi:hypothetical protein
MCSDNNFTLAGVEHGGQCFCGNAILFDAKKADTKECNMPCTSDHAQMCGGYSRMGIFKVQCSGIPVPHPPTPPPTPPPPPTPDVPLLVNPCRMDTYSKLPFCDPKLSIMARVEDAIGRMTQEEKISNLGSSAGPVKGLGLGAYNWWQEGTHGISRVRNDAKTPYETNFPFPITTGMSFNRSLWELTGNRIGREGRAFMNAGNSYSTFWAPVINLAREPRWGRNIETPGTLFICYAHYTLYTQYAMHSLHSLYTHYALTMHSLCTHYALTIRSLCTHYTLTIPIHSLYASSHYTHHLNIRPGEDPFLTGEYATYFVKGFENSPDDPHHVQVLIVVCSHYVQVLIVVCPHHVVCSLYCTHTVLILYSYCTHTVLILYSLYSTHTMGRRRRAASTTWRTAWRTPPRTDSTTGVTSSMRMCHSRI